MSCGTDYDLAGCMSEITGLTKCCCISNVSVAKSLRVKDQNLLEDSEKSLVFLFFYWKKDTKYCIEVFVYANQ